MSEADLELLRRLDEWLEDFEEDASDPTIDLMRDLKAFLRELVE